MLVKVDGEEGGNTDRENENHDDGVKDKKFPLRGHAFKAGAVFPADDTVVGLEVRAVDILERLALERLQDGGR